MTSSILEPWEAEWFIEGVKNNLWVCPYCGETGGDEMRLGHCGEVHCQPMVETEEYQAFVDECNGSLK